MNPDDDTSPDGYIRFEEDLMGFWLPEGQSPDDLELNWIEP